MSQWRSLESPKLKVPLEYREVTPPGAADRVWEIQELRYGSIFKVTLPHGASPKRLSDAQAERAVFYSIEEALLTPPDKEPGETYEISVGSEELAQAIEM
jgi:hypothetical protein